MSKHTPGPWQAVGTYVCGPDNQSLCQTDPFGDRVVALANARLIAAAPDFYSAAKTFLEYREALDDGDDVAAMHFYAIAKKQLEAAIAKAEGRS